LILTTALVLGCSASEEPVSGVPPELKPAPRQLADWELKLKARNEARILANETAETWEEKHARLEMEQKKEAERIAHASRSEAQKRADAEEQRMAEVAKSTRKAKEAEIASEAAAESKRGAAARRDKRIADETAAAKRNAALAVGYTITDVKGTINQYGWMVITGKLTALKRARFVSITYGVYNGDNEKIGTGLAAISGLNAGEVFSFEATCTEDNALLYKLDEVRGF